MYNLATNNFKVKFFGMPYQKIARAFTESALKQKELVLEPRQITALKSAADIVLAIIASAGIISIAILAPNAFKALQPIFKAGKTGRRFSTKEKARKAAKVVYYLKRHNLVKMKRESGEWKIFLSRLGKTRYYSLGIEVLRVPSVKKWDKKWWQVAADIPTKEYRQGADLLRKKLKQLYFFPLQRSLWFYPYDPRREIEFISNHYSVANYVTVMEINRLDKDDEDKLIRYFSKLNIL
jgi:hypothetical protein